MPPISSLLAREAAEAAACARQQLATCGPVLAELASRLAARPPAVVATCARGSSDHAATYGAYLLETALGRIVASVGPSVAPAFEGAGRDRRDTLLLAVSQSGKSPDLVRLAAAARHDGALVVGLVNDTGSPLAAACELVIPLCAGVERGVAATKSFLLACVGLLQVAAAWSGGAELLAAAHAAPDALAAAAALDWTPALAGLADATSCYVVGRGLGLAAALELALKLKETCGLHAEAFSSAEVLHGPIALVTPGFPILALGDDTAQLAQLAQLGATLHRAGPAVTTMRVSPLLAPLCQVQSAYLALPALAARRGRNADAPRHLRKVTETI
jgi:glucosamine--fructose-6-phosphate aminotransferase (isomerizing)